MKDLILFFKNLRLVYLVVELNAKGAVLVGANAFENLEPALKLANERNGYVVLGIRGRK